MNILMLFPGRLDDLPPLISAAISCSRCKVDGISLMILAAGASEPVRRRLAVFGVTVLSLGFESYPSGLGGKAALRVRYATALLRTLRRFRPSVIWAHAGHSAPYVSICRKGHKRKVLYHAHEYYEPGTSLGRNQRYLARVASAIIVPEENRGWLLRALTSESPRIFVIPNKPDYGSFKPIASELTKSSFISGGGTAAAERFVIYQGLLSKDRCIRELLTAFRTLDSPETGLILLGTCPDPLLRQEIARAVKEDGRISWAPRVSPPEHLNVTAGCDVGVLLYSPSTLNNVYCAPNKIWEYALCEVPMLAPRYPGMRSSVEQNQLGVLCDPEDAQSISRGIETLLTRGRGIYRPALRKYWDASPSLVDLYEETLQRLRTDLRRK